MVTKMTKIPLGILKYIQLLYISYFTLSKTIEVGITVIGQEVKKQKLKILWGAGHDTCSHLSTTFS